MFLAILAQLLWRKVQEISKGKMNKPVHMESIFLNPPSYKLDYVLKDRGVSLNDIYFVYGNWICSHSLQYLHLSFQFQWACGLSILWPWISQIIMHCVKKYFLWYGTSFASISPNILLFPCTKKWLIYLLFNHCLYPTDIAPLNQYMLAPSLSPLNQIFLIFHYIEVSSCC